jgi:hypothetical protein
MRPSPGRSGAVWILLALGLSGWGAREALAAAFTIDPVQSSISLSGNVIGYSLQEQAAGSLSTHFEGTVNADVTDVSIAFTGSSLLSTRNSGDWQPKANGADGSEPANYGGKASAGFASALAAVRNAQFDVTSPPLAINGGTFDSGSLVFQFLTNSQGALDYKISGLLSQKGRQALAGIATNKLTTQATLTTSGTTQTLTIPVNTDYFFKLVSANDTKLTLSGQLVATRTLSAAGNTFGDWITSRFPGITDPNIIGPGADSDHDGVPNLVEFAFGTDPSTPDTTLAPLKISPDPADPGKRLFEFIRPKGLSGITYLLRVTDTLTSWETLTATPQIIDLGNGQEKVVVSDTPPPGPNHSRFLLLSVGAN